LIPHLYYTGCHKTSGNAQNDFLDTKGGFGVSMVVARPRSQKLTTKMTVRTTLPLGRSETLGSAQNKQARRPDAPGYITGMWGKWFLVLHEGETNPAIYNQEELKLEPAAYWRVTHTLVGQPYFKEFKTHREIDKHLKELGKLGGVSIAIEGPFYATKALEEGPVPTRNLFDHLNDA